MQFTKVSVIIPCYNVEKYLRECLDSVVNQTLRDIQIICINDGSTDSTLSILTEYAQKDSRIRIIDKPNSGYGDSMNRGLDLAEGEYLGIVESDDFAEPRMFETLYNAAKKDDLDVVRAGYYQYSTEPQVQNIPVSPMVKMRDRKVFCPMTDFSGPVQMANFFKNAPAIWSAIYRRDFIRANDIRFNRTSGASYQDLSFCYKVWFKAKRVRLLNDYLLHYRVDNSQSSIHNPGKVYCICDEYEEIERFLQKNPEEMDLIMPVIVRLKYESYLWNYERLAEHLQKEFIRRFYKEFKHHQENGSLRRENFIWYDWNNLQKILLDPERYHEIHAMHVRGEATPDFYDVYPENRPIKGKYLYYFAENAAGVLKYLKEVGVSGTIKQAAEKAEKVGAKSR